MHSAPRARSLLILVGPSDADILGEHSRELAAAFGARGREVHLVSLPSSDAAIAVESAITAHRPDCVFALSGAGGELRHADGHSLYAALGVPYVGVISEPPALQPALHRDPPPGRLLFLDADHLRASTALGGPLASRVVLEQSGVGESGVPLPHIRRDVAVLYAKDGRDPEEVRATWSVLPTELRELIEETVEQCVWRTDCSIWAWAEARVRGSAEAGTPWEVPDAFLTVVRESERYVRRARATRVLEALLPFPAIVPGGHWAHVDWSRAKARHVPRATLGGLRELMGRSRVVVNVLPTVRHATHVRVIEGMLHGAFVVSDPNHYLDVEVTRDLYAPFDFDEEAIRATVDAALRDIEHTEARTELARVFARERYDRERAVDELLAIMDRVG
ncbi:MAG: hypothetical protein K2X99_05645 [Gemmatimonadaceae bacterium]|nr:hypothetical protein [Gemmatimonadaceae bacterium]